MSRGHAKGGERTLAGRVRNREALPLSSEERVDIGGKSWWRRRKRVSISTSASAEGAGRLTLDGDGERSDVRDCAASVTLGAGRCDEGGVAAAAERGRGEGEEGGDGEEEGLEEHGGRVEEAESL